MEDTEQARYSASRGGVSGPRAAVDAGAEPLEQAGVAADASMTWQARWRGSAEPELLM